MKIVIMIVFGMSVAACNVTGGPYASVAPISGYGTVHPQYRNQCGPDVHVCHYENRDVRGRGQQ